MENTWEFYLPNRDFGILLDGISYFFFFFQITIVLVMSGQCVFDKLVKRFQKHWQLWQNILLVRETDCIL